MQKGSEIQAKFRRRREGRTNYKKRLAQVKSGLDRVVVRKSNKRIIGQIIEYKERGDVILASADSNELQKLYKWPSRSNRSTAYLTGLLLARKAKQKSESLILDIGLSSPVKASIPFVFAKGCVDGGLKIIGKFDMEESAYDSSRIVKYAEALNKAQGSEARQFGNYSKGGTELKSLPNLFKEVRAKLMQSG